MSSFYNRRLMMLELLYIGLPVDAVAIGLGVSERTVARVIEGVVGGRDVLTHGHARCSTYQEARNYVENRVQVAMSLPAAVVLWREIQGQDIPAPTLRTVQKWRQSMLENAS